MGYVDIEISYPNYNMENNLLPTKILRRTCSIW